MGMQGVHATEILAPADAAVGLQAVEPAGPEQGIQGLSVGHRRMRFRTAGGVSALMGPLLTDDGFPDDPAVLPRHRRHGVCMTMGDRHAVVNPRGLIEDRLLGLSDRSRGHHDHPVPENDGRGMSLAGQRQLPADIPSLAPLKGRPSRRGNPVGQRPTPLGPGQTGVLRRSVRGSLGAHTADGRSHDTYPHAPTSKTLQPWSSVPHARGLTRPVARCDRNPGRRAEENPLACTLARQAE